MFAIHQSTSWWSKTNIRKHSASGDAKYRTKTVNSNKAEAVARTVTKRERTRVFYKHVTAVVSFFHQRPWETKRGNKIKRNLVPFTHLQGLHLQARLPLLNMAKTKASSEKKVIKEERVKTSPSPSPIPVNADDASTVVASPAGSKTSTGIPAMIATTAPPPNSSGSNSKPTKFKGKAAPLEVLRNKKKNTRHAKRTESYSSYVYRVLKQVHPDTGISKKAMAVMNSFIGDLFGRIAGEAGNLARYHKKATLTSREIQHAVRLVLPGQVAIHAVSEGTRALTKYMGITC